MNTERRPPPGGHAPPGAARIATGERLAEAGEAVRALTRDPARDRFPSGAGFVQGDLITLEARARGHTADFR